MKPDTPPESFLEKTIFASRWLQAPLYVGLIVAQAVYVYQFFIVLLKTFIEVRSPGHQVNNDGVMWQVIIHVIFEVSAFALAWTDRVMLLGVKATKSEAQQRGA